MSKLVGKFVTEKLSGKRGIVVEKRKKKYTIRVWVPEQSNWYVMDCPKSQFEVGETKQAKKIGY